MSVGRKAVQRAYVLIGCALLSAAWGCAEAPVKPSITTRARPTYVPREAPLGPNHTVVIDAGHGGNDPGTSHNGLQEKVLVLDIAKRLRDELAAAGVNVLLTRDTDRFIPLSSRATVANRVQADLFVSIHVNANKNRQVAGAEVYYPRISIISASANWPPSIVQTEIGMPQLTVKQALWDMVLEQGRANSRRLASSICRSLGHGLQVGCKGKSARFVVLREARMPAVLVEVGYVSNRAEAERLANPAYRQAAAQSIADGVKGYLRQLDAQPVYASQ